MDYLDDKPDWDIAQWYDGLPLWSAPFGLMLLEHVPLQPNMTLLDVGCGTGFPLIELAQRLGRTCRAWGLDPWKAAVERARARAAALGLENVQIVEGDAAAMPFAGAHFDLIVSNLGVNNFADPAAALAECRRVLKPGGTLALTTNLRGHMGLLYEVFEATLRAMGREELLPALHRHVEHRATVEGLSANLRRPVWP